jgi:hypothetical protein
VRKIIIGVLIYSCFILGLLFEWSHRNSIASILPIIWLLCFARAQGIKPIKIRFEAVVLIPLSLSLDALAITHFFQKEWWSGALLLALGLIVGYIGQAMHPELSAAELAGGSHVQKNTPAGKGKLSALSPDEGHEIGKLVVRTFPVLAGCASVILHDYGFKLFWAFLLGLILAGVVSLYSAFATAYRTDDLPSRVSM